MPTKMEIEIKKVCKVLFNHKKETAMPTKMETEIKLELAKSCFFVAAIICWLLLSGCGKPWENRKQETFKTEYSDGYTYNCVRDYETKQLFYCYARWRTGQFGAQEWCPEAWPENWNEICPVLRGDGR